MPAHHVAKAAAVIVAAAAIAVPATAASASEPSPATFVEVLLGPDNAGDLAYTLASNDFGCAEH